MSLSRTEAEEILFREARLIDEGKLREWMELFTKDGIYWLPIDERAAPGRHVSLIFDDALRREERVYRLLDTIAHAQDPTSVTQHFISNVSVGNAETDAPVVYSSQIIYEVRGNGADYRHLSLGEQRSLAARCEHTLRREDNEWKIVMKRLILLNRELPIENLTFVL